MGAMNETIVAGGKAKTTKNITDALGMWKYEMSTMEVPAEYRAMTDHGVAHASCRHKQFDVVSAQSKELYALAQKLTADATEPIKTGMSKAFNKAT
jgi:hypothetical protein